jgi:hypothetical protein
MELSQVAEQPCVSLSDAGFTVLIQGILFQLAAGEVIPSGYLTQEVLSAVQEISLGFTTALLHYENTWQFRVLVFFDMMPKQKGKQIIDGYKLLLKYAEVDLVKFDGRHNVEAIGIVLLLTPCDYSCAKLLVHSRRHYSLAVAHSSSSANSSAQYKDFREYYLFLMMLIIPVSLLPSASIISLNTTICVSSAGVSLPGGNMGVLFVLLVGCSALQVLVNASQC